MSKCKESFDMAVIEHLGLSALAGDKMSIYEAAEIMYLAAWNTRGKVDAEICLEIDCKGMDAGQASIACMKAIEQEDEK